MTIRITEKHDTMILQLVSGTNMSAAAKDTLLQNIKTQLDATVSMFKDSNGNYTVPHVLQAKTIVMGRGK
jgi:hypothetical protein